MSEFAKHMEGVAKVLWGDPNPEFKSKHELRFGAHGARVVDLRKGIWVDHSESMGTPERGGGVLDLVKLELGLETKEAIAWLNDNGFPIEDRAPGSRPDAGRSESRRPAEKPQERATPAGAPKASGGKPKRTIARTYDYRGAAGDLVYQVVRWEPKTFSQRRPSPTEPGVWFWGLDAGDYMRPAPGRDWTRFDEERFAGYRSGERTTLEGTVEHGLYKRPELEETIADGGLVFLPEGEKDVEALLDLGAPATTNSGGAKHWRPELAEIFRGMHVVVPLDHDKPGRERGEILGASLAGIAASIKLLDVAAFWPECPAKGDVSDWIADGLTLERLYEIAAGLPDWTPHASSTADELADRLPDEAPAEAYRPHFRVTRWNDLDREPDKHEWLVKNLFTRGELALLPGASQSGKSFVVLDLAMAIVRGTTFLGKFKTRRGGVVYQVGEGYKGLKTKRLLAYRMRHRLSPADDLPFAFIASPVDLYGDDADTNRLIEDIRHIAAAWSVPLELVVIDTLSAATPGLKENASEDISRVLKRCEQIRRATGATVLLVHHMNADGTKARGHTSLGANVENVITCRKIEDRRDFSRRIIRELEVTKQKDGESGLKIPFVLSALEIGRDEDGDPVTSCTIEEPDRGEGMEEEATAPSGAANLSDDAMEFLRSIERSAEEHGISPGAAGLDLPRKIVRVVEYRHVRAAYVASSFRFADQDEDPVIRARAVQAVVKRLGSSLVRKGLIGRHDRFLWRTDKPLAGQARQEAPSASADGSANLPAVLEYADQGSGSWADLDAQAA